MIAGIERLPYREIWAIDFEFRAPEGERPDPICMVGRKLRSGRILRLWQNELRRQQGAPFPTDATSLFVAYYASAELGCFLALGWPLPVRVLDPFAEFRVATNGRSLPCGTGLLGAMVWHGLDSMSSEEEAEMRDLALRGGPWSPAEQVALLDYCRRMSMHWRYFCRGCCPASSRAAPIPPLSSGRRFSEAATWPPPLAWSGPGIPVDVLTLEALQVHWEAIKAHLVTAVDSGFGVYDGTSFKADRFGGFLNRMGIPLASPSQR